jgi:hypothetical protein
VQAGAVTVSPEGFHALQTASNEHTSHDNDSVVIEKGNSEEAATAAIDATSTLSLDPSPPASSST